MAPSIGNILDGRGSNPDGVRNQMEGGALHALRRALFEEVTWDREKVTSVDWRTYHTFPLGFEIPTGDDCRSTCLWVLNELCNINKHRRILLTSP